MVEHLQFVSDMTDEQVRALTELLAMPPKYFMDGGVPAQEWLARQEDKMASLPRELTKPTNLVDRTRIALAKKGLSTESWIPRVAVLCPVHKLLNPWIVHRVFLLLQHEVMHKVNPIRYYRGELKTQEVLDYCTHVSGILSLFKTRTEFTAMCRGAEYPEHFRFNRVASGCEACVLAVVGARAQLLVDLKASLLARTGDNSRRKHPPRLMRFVDAWLQCFGPANEGELVLAAERLGGQIRAINKLEAKRRREAHRRKKEKIAAIAAERDEMERRLKKQRITASQLRLGLGEIDRKIERKYGKDWERGRFRESRRHHHSSHAKSSTQSRSANENSENRRQVEEQLHTEPQTPRGVDGREVQGQDAEYPAQHGYDIEYDPGHYEEPMHFEQDERNPDHEQQLEESFDDWYQRSISAASRVPSGAEPFDWSRSSTSEFHDSRSFVAKSAVPSPLLIAKNGKGKDKNESGSSTMADGQDGDGDDRSWVSVTVHSNSSSDRVVGAASDAPPVPRIPSKYGVLENLTREEPYAASSVYSSDEISTFTPSPESTPATMAPANRSSTTLPQASKQHSSTRGSARNDDDNASVSTLRLDDKHREYEYNDEDDEPHFSNPWIPRPEPDHPQSVVSSSISPGTRPASQEYVAMQAELEDAFSMVAHDDGVSDEIVRPDDSISQVHHAPARTSTNTSKTSKTSTKRCVVPASVGPVRRGGVGGSRRNDTMQYLGLYRDD